MASLLSNGRKSRLDMPIGIEESRAAQAQDRADRNTALAIKANSTDIRLGRRAYRRAIRKGDVGAISALPILEKMREVTGTTGAGIQMAGALQPAVEQRVQHTREKIDSFGNKTLDDNGRLLPRPQSRILGNGSGLTPQDAKASSNGGEWVNVGGPGDTPGVRTLEHRNWSGVRDGKLGDEPAVQTNRPLSSSVGFVADTRQQFARDLSVSKLIEDGDKGALSRAVERGARLGLSREQVLNYTGNNQPAEPAGPPAPEGMGAQPSSRLFSPEEMRQLRRVVGLFGPNRANGDELQIRGEIAAGDAIESIRNTSLGDVTGALRGGAEAIASRLTSGLQGARQGVSRLLQPPAQAASPSVVATPASALLSGNDSGYGGRLNVSFDTHENRRFSEAYNEAMKTNKAIDKSLLLSDSLLGSLLRRDPRMEAQSPKKSAQKNIFGL